MDHSSINFALVKESISFLVILISHIANIYFEMGILPDRRKIAKVIPIFKSELKDFFINYRPDPLLPQFQRNWKNFFNNRLNKFLEINNTIDFIKSFRYHWSHIAVTKIRKNESGLRPLLCTYRLNWARRIFWRLWDEWDDTALQTQDSKCEPWRSEAEHATSRSCRLPTILSSTSGWGRNIFVSFKPPRPGTEHLKSSVKGSGANHYPRVPAHKNWIDMGLEV